MLLRDFMKASARKLETLYPSHEAESIVRILVEDMLGLDRSAILSDPLREIPDCKSAPAAGAGGEEDGVGFMDLNKAVDRLLGGEPVQYVTGRAAFYGRNFRVSPSVLIPRQETEILVHEVLSRLRDFSRPSSASLPSQSSPLSPSSVSPAMAGLRILDLCTGSGCIAWTLAAELPGSEVTAVDVSDAALSVAASQPIPIPNPPIFLKADVLAASPADALAASLADVPAGLPADKDIPEPSLPGGGYDIIVANPPYVRDSERGLMHRNVLEHEPEIALFVRDEDPLIFYRAIARIAAACLSDSPDSFGIVEINEAFASEVGAIFLDAGFSRINVICDFCNKSRHILFLK